MPPRVTIALPVRNGENFLGRALSSIASQTLTDYELLISDNASTDRTWAIIQQHAALDPRVRAERLEENAGAAENFNRLVPKARAPLFKWASHDDVLAPGFLAACVGALDADAGMVCCHTTTALIDETDAVRGVYQGQPGFAEADAAERFERVITVPHRCFHAFGVMRTDVLAATGLIGAYTGSDRTLIAELAMRGTLGMLEPTLFGRRDHAEASIRKHVDERERAAWFDPKLENAPPVGPTWRRLLGYAEAIERAGLGWTGSRPYYEALSRWIEGRHQTGRLVREMLADELAVDIL